jgi:cell division protein ZipA
VLCGAIIIILKIYNLMTLTAWLLVFGGLTVTAIVIDGLRRMFASHAALKIDIDESLCGLPQEKYSSELPNGGARIVGPESIVIVPDQVPDQVPKQVPSNDNDVEFELFVDLEPIALVVEELVVETSLNMQPEEIAHMEEAVVEEAVVVEKTAVAEILDEAETIVFEHNKPDHEVDVVVDPNNSVVNEEIFFLNSTPLSLSAEEIAALTSSNITPDVAIQTAAPSLSFDPTRPVHEMVETTSMVQSDLFAEQDLTKLAAIRSNVTHQLHETSDDILFSDTGIDDLQEKMVASNAKDLVNQDESLSTKLAKVTSMTFGKKLLSRKRVAAQEVIELAAIEERSRNIPVIEQVISILVTANDSQGFYGPQLLKLVEACGLVHGDMDIFHRFEDGLRLGKNQFSMANMMEPGTFNLTQMDNLHTPGVVFFLGLPTAQNSMQAFDYMLETAHCLAANLGGKVLDEQRSVMRPQTIEHCRQQIREFERRHMSRRAQL